MIKRKTFDQIDTALLGRSKQTALNTDENSSAGKKGDEDFLFTDRQTNVTFMQDSLKGTMKLTEMDTQTQDKTLKKINMVKALPKIEAKVSKGR